LAKPSPSGAFAQATAAFLRVHETLEVVTKPTAREKERDANAQPRTRTERRPIKTLGKYARLLDDLAALRAEEPSFHAVVFSRFDEVQCRVVQLLAQESKPGGCLYAGKALPLKIFEFNKHTQPTTRHKRIQEFQQGMDKEGGPPKVFIVTYQTAAVGITLTAASRIFLMEPMPDPAHEVQAAGRIHRLGQTKDVFIKRYAFRDSIEEATDKLHEAVRSGRIKIRDGRFPPEAHDLFRLHGPSAGLFKQRGDEHGRVIKGEGILDWQGALRRPQAKKGEPPIVLQPSSWTRQCTEEECRLCSVRRVRRGSSRWDGTGIFAYLSGGAFDQIDPPPPGHGVGHFWAVPTPPDSWQPERFGDNPLALLNVRSVRDTKKEELEKANGTSASGDGAAGAGGASGAGEADDDEEEEDEDFKSVASEQCLDCSEGETDELYSETDDDDDDDGGGASHHRTLAERRPWLSTHGFGYNSYLYGAYASTSGYDLSDEFGARLEFQMDYPECFSEETDDPTEACVQAARDALAEIAAEAKEGVEYEDDEAEATALEYAAFLEAFEPDEPEPPADADEFYRAEDEDGGGE